MEKKNEKGKPTIEISSLPKSKRKKIFLVCGSCNVVSIAGNAAIEGKAGADNKDMPDKKRCTAVGEAQSDDIRSTYHNGEKSNLRPEFKDLDKLQSLRNGPQGQTMERHEGVTKICWSRSDNDDDDDEVDGQSSVESFVEQKWSELPQNNLKQQLHEAEDWENGKDARMQQTASPKRRPKLKTKRIALPVEPLKGQSQVFVENEPPSPPLMKDSMYSGKQASYKPETSKMNDAVVKPALVENGPGATGTPGNRWKRLASLKFKFNRIDGKRMERDDETVHEEYEMMMENLKMYGVL